MQNRNPGKGQCYALPFTTKTLLAMKLTAILLLAACLNLSARGYAQKVSLSETNVSLEKVLREITKQTGCQFVYDENTLIRASKVSITISNADLETALNLCFARQPLTYSIVGQNVVVKAKDVMDLPVVAKDMLSAITIRGRITNETGEPVLATIAVKGTKHGTITNEEGYYVLNNVDDNAILVISGVSIEPVEIRVNNRTLINVPVKLKVTELDAPIVVAYGTTTNRANVGAVNVVSGEKIRNLPSRSFDRSLQGLVPGMFITKGSGQPGAGLSNMVLRGISTGSDVSFGSTARNPLIVIDGVPVSQDNAGMVLGSNENPTSNPLAQLNPADIESISILKDAVAIALYGSKASNGVILVTTKRGKTGRTVFNFSHQTDVATRLKGNVELLNQDEYLTLLYETYKNTDAVRWTDQAIQEDLKRNFPTRADGNFYTTPDWYEAMFRTAISTSDQLSISGGNEKSTFYANLEHSKQNGIIRKTGYGRTSFRLNQEQRPLTWLKFGLNSTFSYNKQDLAASVADGLEVFSPLLPIKFDDGSYPLIFKQGSTFVQANPAAAQDYNSSSNVGYRGLAKLYGEVRFSRSLSFVSSLGVDYMADESKLKFDPRLIEAYPSMITERIIRRTAIVNTNLFRFNKSIGANHNLGVTLGHEVQISNEKIFAATAKGTAETSPYYEQLTSPGYTISEVGSSTRKQLLLSLFGQVNYQYKNKYFLSTGLRKDASSKFGEQQRWGTYWSAGAGWLVTEEKFIKNNLPWLSYFKIRGSLGVAGNSSALDEFVRFDRLRMVTVLGTPAVTFSSPGNPDARWEKTFNWNAGVDLRLFDQRVSISADIYEKKTSDLLYQTNLPSVAGYSFVIANVGDINNKGIEVSASVNVINNKSFRWTIGGNWSTNDNILVKANVPLAALSGGVLANEVGRNFNSYYMPVWAGVNPADGKPQWLDDQGKPTSDYYGKAKKQFVGKPQPDGFGGLSNTFQYKNVSLSADIYYQYGVSIYNEFQGNFLLNDGQLPFLNQVKEALNYWKAPGDHTPNPRRTLDNIDFGNAASTRYLFTGEYLRLANLKVGYNFPVNMLSSLHLSGLSIFLQANNLLTITNFSGPDPDNVNVGGSIRPGYPNERNYSFVLNASF